MWSKGPALAKTKRIFRRPWSPHRGWELTDRVAMDELELTDSDGRITLSWGGSSHRGGSMQSKRAYAGQRPSARSPDGLVLFGRELA